MTTNEIITRIDRMGIARDEEIRAEGHSSATAEARFIEQLRQTAHPADGGIERTAREALASSPAGSELIARIDRLNPRSTDAPECNYELMPCDCPGCQCAYGWHVTDAPVDGYPGALQPPARPIGIDGYPGWLAE